MEIPNRVLGHSLVPRHRPDMSGYEDAVRFEVGFADYSDADLDLAIGCHWAQCWGHRSPADLRFGILKDASLGALCCCFNLALLGQIRRWTLPPTKTSSLAESKQSY